MKGTEKQIKWAEDIKALAYRNIDSNIELLKERLEKYPNWENVRNEIKGYEMVRDIINKFFSQTDDAAVIIKKRDILSGEMILEQARAYAKKLNTNM